MAKPGQIIYVGTLKNGGKFIVRYPRLQDAKALMEFINRLSKEKTFILMQGEQMSLKAETKWLKGIIKNIRAKKAIHLIIFHNGEVIGGSSISLLEKVRRPVGDLAISVAKGFRGEGLGKLLMKLALKEAKANLKGLKVVSLDVFAINKKAYSLYKKMGFKKYGVLPKGIIYKGKLINDILMYKKI